MSTSYSKRSVFLSCWLAGSPLITVPATASSLYEIAKERLQEGETSVHSALYHLRSAVSSLKDRASVPWLDLGFDLSTTGVTSPWNLFSQLENCTKALDFWQNTHPQDETPDGAQVEDPRTPSMKSVLDLVGSPQSPQAGSLYGCLQTLQSHLEALTQPAPASSILGQPEADTPSIYRDTIPAGSILGQPDDNVPSIYRDLIPANSILGQPDDDSSSTLYGVLRLLTRALMTQPLLAMLSKKPGLEALLLDLEKAVQERCAVWRQDPSLQPTAELVLRSLGSYENEIPMYPESCLSLAKNLFQQVTQSPLLSFSTFQLGYEAFEARPKEVADPPGEHLYDVVRQLLEKAQQEDTTPQDLLACFTSDTGELSLRKALLNLREAWVQDLLTWAGGEGAPRSELSLQGHIALLFDTWRTLKNDLGPCLDDGETLVKRKLLDVATTLEHLASMPVTLQLSDVFKGLYVTLPEQLLCLGKRLRAGDSVSNERLLQSSIGFEDDLLSDGTLLGTLDHIATQLLSPSLARALGTWPLSASLTHPPYDTLSSSITSVIQTVAEAKTTATTTLLQREVLGDKEGQTHETVTYGLRWLDFLSRQISVEELPSLLSFAAPSSLDTSSWRDRLENLRLHLTEDLQAHGALALLSFFPDMPTVIHDDASPSWTKALWEQLKSLFPLAWSSTLEGPSPARPSLRCGTSLTSHLAYWLDAETVQRDLQRSLSPAENDLLQKCQRELAALSKMGTSPESLTSSGKFLFFEKMGTPFLPAPQTVWKDLLTWEQALLSGAGDSLSKGKIFEHNLRSLRQSLQPARQRALSHLNSWKDAVDTLTQKLTQLEGQTPSEQQLKKLGEYLSLLTSSLNQLLADMFSTEVANKASLLEDHVSSSLQNLMHILALFEAVAPELGEGASDLDGATTLPQSLERLASSLLNLATKIALLLPSQPPSLGLLSFAGADLRRYAASLKEVANAAALSQLTEDSSILDFSKQAFVNLADAFERLADAVEAV